MRNRRNLVALAGRIHRAHAPWSSRERRIALGVVRELGEGEPATPSVISRRTAVPRLEVEATVARWPGLQRDESGRVIGFCGLSTSPTAHRMRVGRRSLYGWCAWDTLFLPQLLGEEARVESQCATTGETIDLRVGSRGVQERSPVSAVLSFLELDRRRVAEGATISCFCRHVLFFASMGAWRAWAEDREPTTFALTVEEGWELGRLVNRLRFGTGAG